MWLQILVKKDIETKNLEAHVSVFIASLIASCNLRLVSNTRLDHDILDSIHDLLEIDTVPLEPFLELEQVPL